MKKESEDRMSTKSNDTKHTPGPWEVQDSKFTDDGHYVCVQLVSLANPDKPVTIAEFFPVNGAELANAQKCASAPALLAERDALLGNFNISCDVTAVLLAENAALKDQNAALRLAEAALVKALEDVARSRHGIASHLLGFMECPYALCVEARAALASCAAKVKR